MSDRARREHDALIAAGMRANEMSVFHALRLRGDPQTGAVRDDLPTLARASGLSLRPFRKALRALESLGVVMTQMAKRQGGPQGAAWVWVRRVQPRESWATEIGPPIVRREEAVTVTATTKSIATKSIATKSIATKSIATEHVSREIGVSHVFTISSSGATAATNEIDRFFHQQGLHAVEVKSGQGAEASSVSALRVNGSDAVEVGGSISSSATPAEGVRATGVSALWPSGSVTFGMCGLSSSNRSGQDPDAERLALASVTTPSVASAKTWREIERPPEAARKPVQPPNPKVVAEAVQRYSSLLAVLQDAPGWPYDEPDDALMLAQAEARQPQVDLRFEVGQFYWWRADFPEHVASRRGFQRFIDRAAKYDQRGNQMEREWQRERADRATPNLTTVVCTDTEDDHIAKVLDELKDAINYRYDEVRDREFVQQIVSEYPGVDVVDAVRDWDLRRDNTLLDGRDSPRASLRSFLRKFVAWGKASPRSPTSL